MAKFVFQLEAVLRARVAEERERQLALGVIERERAALEDRIREWQRGIVAAKDDLREELDSTREGAPVDLQRVRLQAGASLHLVARAQRAVLELAGVHRRLDAARLELLQASIRRKAVESLRDRRLEEWRYAEKSREAAGLDELMVMRASRPGDDI